MVLLEGPGYTPGPMGQNLLRKFWRSSRKSAALIFWGQRKSKIFFVGPNFGPRPSFTGPWVGPKLGLSRFAAEDLGRQRRPRLGFWLGRFVPQGVASFRLFYFQIYLKIIFLFLTRQNQVLSSAKKLLISAKTCLQVLLGTFSWLH